MLSLAGLTLSDPLLPTLFRVGHVADATFSFLEHALHPRANPKPSYQLLGEIAARTAKFASWSEASSSTQETLALINFDSNCTQSKSDFPIQAGELIFQVKLPAIEAEATTGQTDPYNGTSLPCCWCTWC